MPANPRLLTLGDMVYARDSQPGDILVLDKDLIPEWTSLEELADRIAEVLKARPSSAKP